MIKDGGGNDDIKAAVTSERRRRAAILLNVIGHRTLRLTGRANGWKAPSEGRRRGAFGKWRAANWPCPNILLVLKYDGSINSIYRPLENSFWEGDWIHYC